ncbi:hypothetical protein [Aquimarina aquimarini]|uniref:hypothetical protein n=1 Tax=Aquimarina aquimarini TaxID=1191734 RepID=UPI000D5505C9|nr:hypothetical protein [Aquimarina aquimarini]
MTDIEVYLGHLGFEGMAKEFSSEIQKTIAKTLKEEAMYPSADPARALHMNIKAKATKLAQDPMFKRDSPNDDYEIKEIEYVDKVVDGTLQGTMIITCGHKHNPYQYGKPGFPGEVDGQLLQDEFCTVYKWHEQSRRWYLLKDHPNHYCEEPEKEKSWTDRLMGNAAFEPLYGNGYRGGTGDSFNTGRRGQPDGGILGDPGITPGGGGGLDWKKRGMKLLFGATVHLVGILDKAKSIYDTYDKTSGNKENTNLSSLPEEIKKKRGLDTITYNAKLGKVDNAFPYDTIAKISKDIKGYQNALKYQNYHVNMDTRGFHWHVEITPKYEE